MSDSRALAIAKKEALNILKIFHKLDIDDLEKPFIEKYEVSQMFRTYGGYDEDYFDMPKEAKKLIKEIQNNQKSVLKEHGLTIIPYDSEKGWWGIGIKIDPEKMDITSIMLKDNLFDAVGEAASKIRKELKLKIGKAFYSSNSIYIKKVYVMGWDWGPAKKNRERFEVLFDEERFWEIHKQLKKPFERVVKKHLSKYPNLFKMNKIKGIKVEISESCHEAYDFTVKLTFD